MHDNTPERFIWATETMGIQPNFNILEIGCGAGILADCIADKLETGIILAVDKSAPMIEKAKKRNKKHIDNDRITFSQGEFAKIVLTQHHFDRIVAFNVNFFWKGTKIEFEIIRQALKQNGILYIFYQAPYEITLQSAEPIKTQLVKNGFSVIDIRLNKLRPTSALCVMAIPTIKRRH